MPVWEGCSKIDMSLGVVPAVTMCPGRAVGGCLYCPLSDRPNNQYYQGHSAPNPLCCQLGGELTLHRFAEKPRLLFLFLQESDVGSCHVLSRVAKNEEGK